MNAQNGQGAAQLPEPPPLLNRDIKGAAWNPENTVAPPQQSASQAIAAWIAANGLDAPVPISLIHQQERERLQAAAAAAANGTGNAQTGVGVPPQQSATQAIAAWVAANGINAPVPINLIHQQERERLQAAAAAAANTANVQSGPGSAAGAIATGPTLFVTNPLPNGNLDHVVIQLGGTKYHEVRKADGTLVSSWVEYASAMPAGAPGSLTASNQQTASAGSGGATQSGPFNLPDNRGYAGGITKNNLAGGGYELVRPVGGNEVHDVYGPANQLLTTYTKMPDASVTMNSGMAATTNATAAPATTRDLPGGGLEVIHPSEFVPGVNNHLIYGPKNAAGDRSLVTSFLQPPPLYGTSHLGPAQTMTLDTEKGVSSGPTPFHPAETVPENANTLISRAAADKRGEMLHELNATTLRSSAAINPGAATPTAIRQSLEQEMKSALAATGGNASSHGTSGATTSGVSRQNLEQEMKSALAPTGGNTTSHETSGVQKSNTLRKFESVVTPHANTPANATANTTANAPTNATSRLHETLPRSTDAAIVHSNATVATTHAPVMLAPVRLLPPPPPPPPRKK